MTRGHRGTLPLRRRALPSPTPCRFIPAHPRLLPKRHYAAGYISSALKDTITLAILVIVLVVRPQGLWSIIEPDEGVAAHH